MFYISDINLINERMENLKRANGFQMEFQGTGLFSQGFDQ